MPMSPFGFNAICKPDSGHGNTNTTNADIEGTIVSPEAQRLMHEEGRGYKSLVMCGCLNLNFEISR
jgi:hypothetical protein